MAYFELCRWEIEIDPNIESAVGKRTDHQGAFWAGLETVESANVKLDFLIEKRMAGVMFWALDMDDYNGNFCGDVGEENTYPIIRGIYKNLLEKWDVGPTQPPTTTQPAPTTRAPRPSADPINVCYFTSWAQYRAHPATFHVHHIDPHLC